jgi:sortase A
MRRTLRVLGTLMVIAGVCALAWTLLVWQWQDPLTALYTRYEQHQLASQLDRRIADFAHRDTSGRPSLAAQRRQVARDALRYRRETRRGDAIGRISIPRLDLRMVLVDGTDHDSLTKGPGRDLRTFMPGEGELVYIAGHRTTYLAPFSHIDRLRAGDPVTIELPYATFDYRVVRHVIVPADDVGRLRSHHREVLVLQACHPRFFATERYLVYARPVRVTPRLGPPFAASATPLAAPG